MIRTRGHIVILLLTACTFAACDESSQSRDATHNNARNTINFTVDSDGVSYLYRHPSRGLHVAARLDDIPLEHRVAVIPVTSDTPASSPEQRSFPVANLLDAAPGEDATATWMTKKTFVRRNLASARGHSRADRVRFWAQEVTQLSPTSKRARSSDRALRLLEEIEPPSDEEPPARHQDTP